MFGDALQKGVKKKKMFPFYVLRSLPASPHICSMKIFDNIVQYLLLRIAVLERRRAKLSDCGPERPAELRHAGSGVRAGEAAGRAGQADVEHGVGGGAGEEGVGVGHLHQTPVEMVESRGRVESLFTLAGVAAPHPAVARLEGALQIRKKNKSR